jgi:perosamine synthetase
LTITASVLMSSNIIPLSVPHLAGNEWSYIKECLDTNWVSYVGPFVERFERELAAKAGAKQCVATSSGTAALHIALILAGVRPNDEVVMPGITFVAPANAVRYCFAWPTLVDINPLDWQVDVNQIADFLARDCSVRKGQLCNKATGRRIAALMPVHLLGGMCDLDAVAELATRYELPLIEDAAECLGATYKGRAIAAPCVTYRGPLRLVATSFNGNKIVTTGGGGAIFSEDPVVAARAKHLTTTAKTDEIEFFHDEVGYNYRLTNMAAALGVAQLEKLEKYVETKRNIARCYAALFANCDGIDTHPEPAACQSIFWMYSVRLNRQARPVIDRLIQCGITVRPVWVPLQRLPAFETVYSVGSIIAEDFYRHGISLPCSVGLTEDEITTVARQLILTLNEMPEVVDRNGKSRLRDSLPKHAS